MTAAGHIDIAVDPGAPAGLDPDYLRRLGRYALEQLDMDQEGALSILITDDATIAELHAAHMGIEGPTDILTFALDEGDPFVSAEEEPLIGEIIISHQTASANAAHEGHSVEREIAFLVLHGLLHLKGYDDQTTADRAAMLNEQERLLTGFEQGQNARA